MVQPESFVVTLLASCVRVKSGVSVEVCTSDCGVGFSERGITNGTDFVVVENGKNTGVSVEQLGFWDFGFFFAGNSHALSVVAVVVTETFVATARSEGELGTDTIEF